MPLLPDPSCLNFQRRFAQRWNHLQHPHVRSLAWLLDAPDMLDATAPYWNGRVATLGKDCAQNAAPWLAELDADPSRLVTWLDMGAFARLGRFAEKLLAFYFHEQGTLAGHGIQVRDGNLTIGEFDYLLEAGDGALVHIEFATKFYLLEETGAGQESDYFVGPNLADTLGQKMSKIFDRQLQLAFHPAAAAVLPRPVTRAQALVKGWLFYHDESAALESIGLDPAHCRGFWRALGELDLPDAQACTLLQRLDWLAPARLPDGAQTSIGLLKQELREYFAHDTMPVMLAVLEPDGQGGWQEISRGFVVPDDWQERAGERRRPKIKG